MALISCKECGAQVSTEAKNCPHCGAKIKKPLSLGGFLLVLLTGYLVYQCTAAVEDGEQIGRSLGEHSASLELDSSSVSVYQAIRSIDFDFEWKRGGFDTAMLVDFKFKNNGTSDVKDITISCDHKASSGTKIDSNERVIYEIIKAGETKRVKDFNMGFIHSQANSSSCKITDLVVL
ncbi:MAG: zinc ribbon domain-containing protein [Pseudomonadota bacterium]|nr:zinc ribbon domain-containing protein [Pseudomonadota bacterium]